jgi:hypothetical protein
MEATLTTIKPKSCVQSELARISKQATQIQQGTVQLKAVVVPKSGEGHYTVRIESASSNKK